MLQDNISNDDIVTDDIETRKNIIQIYVALWPLKTKSEESEKEKNS